MYSRKPFNSKMPIVCVYIYIYIFPKVIIIKIYKKKIEFIDFIIFVSNMYNHLVVYGGEGFFVLINLTS